MSWMESLKDKGASCTELKDELVEYPSRQDVQKDSD
jgi:hypothetical protein